MRVAIIGGGFSGLAAGVALAERGHEVTLLERRNHLGGRAYSFIDARTGDVVDNGQHLFMGCYHHTIAFLEKIGCRDRLRFQDNPRVDFLDKDQVFDTFKCPALPSPLHVLAGLLRMKGISAGDKFRLLNIGRAIRKSETRSSTPMSGNPDNGLRTTDYGLQSVTEWLKGLGQSERIRQRFWNPMAVATLNENPDKASARMMKKVLEEAFGGDRAGTSIGISRVGLSDLYTVGAQDYIEAHGGQVRTGSLVYRLIIENHRIMAAELKDGETIKADAFISAVPPVAFLELLPEELRAGEFAPVASLESSPIVSINLWFDRPVTDREFVGLLGTRIQWLFNKDAIFANGRQTNQIAIVISAARDFIDRTKPDLVEMAGAELRELLPQGRSARLLHSVIVKEREATISHTVESDSLRPGARTSLKNLILAGDWTATGLPATIESAVLSGNLAAGMIDKK